MLQNVPCSKTSKYAKRGGKAISDYSADDILFFSDIINNLPRKILNYQTPEQFFEQQLDLIYAV